MPSPICFKGRLWSYCHHHNKLKTDDGHYGCNGFHKERSGSALSVHGEIEGHLSYEPCPLARPFIPTINKGALPSVSSQKHYMNWLISGTVFASEI